jgi:ribosome-associated protein
MAKKIVKKKAAKKTGETPKKKRKITPLSAKGSKKSAPKKKVVKKVLTEKEKEFRQANLIANTEKKKKGAKRPKKITTDAETTGLINAIVEGMQEKKAKNITIINLTKIENSVCDYFVICDADSKIHVEAIADSVEEFTEKRANEKPYHAEGFENAEWILMDYINVVVHVFQKEVRDYYNVEALWADAEFEYA